MFFLGSWWTWLSFDFYIYANAAVLVFPNCFFLTDEYQLVLLSLAVFDSISFSLVQQYLAIMVIRSGAKLRW
jgi:hypothetical protein